MEINKALRLTLGIVIAISSHIGWGFLFLICAIFLLFVYYNHFANNETLIMWIVPSPLTYLKKTKSLLPSIWSAESLFKFHDIDCHEKHIGISY